LSHIVSKSDRIVPKEEFSVTKISIRRARVRLNASRSHVHLARGCLATAFRGFFPFWLLRFGGGNRYMS
jgi:hypothetical protein